MNNKKAMKKYDMMCIVVYVLFLYVLCFVCVCLNMHESLFYTFLYHVDI